MKTGQKIDRNVFGGTPANQEILDMREKQRMEFKEIGKALGVSRAQANSLFNHAVSGRKHKREWYSGLTVRALTVMRGAGLDSREKILNAVQTGRLGDPSRMRNYATHTHETILKWLGLPVPERPEKKSWVCRCPHCGERIVKSHLKVKKRPQRKP